MEREEEGKEYGRSVYLLYNEIKRIKKKYKRQREKKKDRRERDRLGDVCLGSPNNATHTVPIIQSVVKRLLSVSL
jgi:hypothetical protein